MTRTAANFVTPIQWVTPIVIAMAFILLVFLIKEPARKKFMAILIAGAGSVYWSGGFGPWEMAFGALLLTFADRAARLLALATISVWRRSRSRSVATAFLCCRPVGSIRGPAQSGIARKGDHCRAALASLRSAAPSRWMGASVRVSVKLHAVHQYAHAPQ